MERNIKVVQQDISGDIALYDVFKGEKQLGVIVKSMGQYAVYSAPDSSELFKKLYLEGQTDFTTGYDIEDNRFHIFFSTYPTYEEAYEALLKGKFCGIYEVH